MYLKKFTFTFVSLILCSLIYLAWVVLTKPTIERDLRAQYLKAGDFQLELDDKPFRLSDLSGNPVILYFGYTSCPDVCPVGLAVIRDVLNSERFFDPVKVLFITLDPERDTPDKLKEYAAFFHKNILPLRGSLEDTKDVIEAYGGFFRKGNLRGDGSYVVDHSAYYYLIDSEGRLVRVFDHSATVNDIVESLRAVL